MSNNTIDWKQSQKPFSNEVTRASQEHAFKMFPNESVGIVVNDTYIPVENTHDDPLNHFQVSDDVVVKYGKDIQAVIHSHNLDIHPGHPSEHDMLVQEKWAVPFGIQLINKNGPGNIVWWGDQLPTAHYVGRPYIYGIYDCYSVWRDYYRVELGVPMPVFPRRDDFWETGNNMIEGNAISCGFEQIEFDEMQPNDVILLKIRSNIANHGVLYMGGDKGLHHLPYKTSSHEIVSKYIDPRKELFHSVWRYKG